MMQSLNPFTRKTISYRDLSKESSEQDRDNGGESSSADSQHHDADNDYLLAHRFYRPRSSRCMYPCGYIVVALMSLTVGLVFSQLFRLEREIKGYPKPYDSPQYNVHDVVWQQNASYAGEPSEENDKLWADLIPHGRGFIKHPVLAKDEQKAVSVYHQIHCLHGLRAAYYKNAYLVAKLQHEQSARHPSRSSNDHPHIPAFTPNPYIESLIGRKIKHSHTAGHIPHCIDYLRQALICAADSNLEDTFTDKNANGEDLIGDDGWGTKRVCRDYSMIGKWSEKWNADPTQGGGID